MVFALMFIFVFCANCTLTFITVSRLYLLHTGDVFVQVNTALFYILYKKKDNDKLISIKKISHCDRSFPSCFLLLFIYV